jgi:hypothetical protein
MAQKPAYGPPLVARNAIHARAVCDLLAALTAAYQRDAKRQPGGGESPVQLTEQWIDTIAELSCSEDRPEHETAIAYVRDAATGFAFAAKILRAERGLSNDPEGLSRAPTTP